MQRLINYRRFFLLICVFVTLWFNSYSQQNIRQDILLNKNWYTIASKDDKIPADDMALSDADEKFWKAVDIPHNWDAYEGYRRLLHGNRHGNAWYRKTFSIRQSKNRKRFFLFFEGVGSYAIVYLNGFPVGEHAGGRTTFTIDVTARIKTDGSTNELAVRADHPSVIKNLPWVCGGCSDERGFSEGSQPMGIFRPVHLIVTNDVRIEPFGVHAWSEIKDKKALLSVNSTIRNYSGINRSIVITNQLADAKGKIVAESTSIQLLKPSDSISVLQNNIAVNNPVLWSTENPYLYKVITVIKERNVIIDRVETDFGFRTINWKNSTNQFFLNGQPVFINGVAEYEHQLGQSHAFSSEQIVSRMNWLKMAGFNGFRDGHQPHNLLYGSLCNKMGILWWTQLSAHIWYDSPEFRNNFKQLLKEWVIERRNDPSVVLWGLQNESKLPEDFAKECTELIRQLDPTTSSQRLVTTCNGGSGTDWDVPQNWTGTYGGDPDTYANDVKKQVLIGEFGAWRTIDLHTEGPFVQNGILSEDRMTLLMEQKVRLAESVKDSSSGQFFWLLTSHDNPGRVQGGEGLRELDRVGPVNYKGLLTSWEEPLDVFYMFRSNYAPKEKEPMVYIVSHTWPSRWKQPGIKDSIIVYSNCDEVELFNDINKISLGKRKRKGIGTHFQWDQVSVQYNVLFAIGYVNGKAVTKDMIVLNHLPKAPGLNDHISNKQNITRAQPGYNYLYRVNCGGPDYKDKNGNEWSADRGIFTPQVRFTPASLSWSNDFPGIPAFFASQRRTFNPVNGTNDSKLFQDFRYGRDRLRYFFPLPEGEYLVEFYFSEPWLGVGGGMDCAGMRLFDIAINNKTVLKDIDIWKQAGTNTALKKTVKARVSGGIMVITFPNTKAGQAIISAIAVASLKKNIKTAPYQSLVRLDKDSPPAYRATTWLDIGDRQYSDDGATISFLPPNLYGAEWLQFSKMNKASRTSFLLADDADVFIATKDKANTPKDYENTLTTIETDEEGGTNYMVFRKRFSKDEKVQLTANEQYLVAVLPVSSMQPAYDLKQVTQYRSNVAQVSDGIKKEALNGRECVVIRSNERVFAEWPIHTGVADIYSLTVKYFYPLEKELKGRLQLTGAGNTMMLDDEVSFTFTRSGKWNQFTINTGTMINAGNYTVKLVIEGAEGLAISSIDVQ